MPGRISRRMAVLNAMSAETMPILYPYNTIDQIVTMGGKRYRLLTITTSGNVNIPLAVAVDAWLCGGGSKGYNQTGGAGARSSQSNAMSLAANTNYMAIIGSAGGASSFNGLAVTAVGQSSNGGTGGGGVGGSGAGSGDGVAKIPFGASDYFTSVPCAGGGGGSSNWEYQNPPGYHGGKGGSNGANGASGGQAGAPSYAGSNGAGGDTGGGAGGGGHATFYGSGGGGYSYYNSNPNTDVGNGYQGALYVRIPL